MMKLTEETEEMESEICRLKRQISGEENDANERAKRIKTEKARQGFLKHCQKAIHQYDSNDGKSN
jgi:hypothetical protein